MTTTTTKYRTKSTDRKLTNLEERLQAVEEKLDCLDGSERAHVRARKQDAREHIQRGDTLNLVVTTPPEENDGPEAVSKINGIYTFIDANYHDLNRGDEIRVRIVDVGANHAEAMLIERISCVEAVA